MSALCFRKAFDRSSFSPKTPPQSLFPLFLLFLCSQQLWLMKIIHMHVKEWRPNVLPPTHGDLIWLVMSAEDAEPPHPHG